MITGLVRDVNLMCLPVTVMLRQDIIKKSKADRKAYELFVLLGGMYDAVIKEEADLDEMTSADKGEDIIMRVIRGSLITLNDVKFDFFHEIMTMIDFIDETSVFGNRNYRPREFVNLIEDILVKMDKQFSWFGEVKGVEMTNEEILELLGYDLELSDFVEALEKIDG